MTHRRLHGALPPLNEYLRMSARAPSAPQRRGILVYDSGWWSDGAPRSISGGILGIALLLCFACDAARQAALQPLVSPPVWLRGSSWRCVDLYA